MGTSIVKDSPDNESKTDRQCIENGSIEQHDLGVTRSDFPPISTNNYQEQLRTHKFGNTTICDFNHKIHINLAITYAFLAFPLTLCFIFINCINDMTKLTKLTIFSEMIMIVKLVKLVTWNFWGSCNANDIAQNYGFCAAQNTHYYGYKLHALCGLKGVIHSYDLSKASVDDRYWLQDLKYEYQQSTIIGDKGYLKAALQLDLFETVQIHLEVPYRLNQKNWKTTFKPFAKARKRVETLFSQLDDQCMVCRNYAKQQTYWKG